MSSVYWTHDRVIQTLRSEAERLGRTPTRLSWANGTPDHPANTTVCDLFGSWSKGIEAAGLTPNKGGVPTASKESIVAALLDYVAVHGHWPSKSQWDQVHKQRDVPAQETIERIFGGSWLNALRAAGWSAECRYCGGELKGQRRFWCSDAHRNRFLRTGPMSQTVAACSGCGGDMDGVTFGCKQCSERHRNRRRWRDPVYRAKHSRQTQQRRARTSAARRLAAVEPSCGGAVPASGRALTLTQTAA